MALLLRVFPSPIAPCSEMSKRFSSAPSRAPALTTKAAAEMKEKQVVSLGKIMATMRKLSVRADLSNKSMTKRFRPLCAGGRTYESGLTSQDLGVRRTNPESEDSNNPLGLT